MTLVVEDGTGKSNANAYVSVADADARHTLLGNTAWTGATATKEAAIARATAYMEQAYRSRWVGLPRHPRSALGTSQVTPQALSWPRWDVWVDGYPVDVNSVPAEVANACADLALKALSAELNVDLARAVVRKKIGPLETEYDRNSPQSIRYRAIDMALAPYLKGSPAMASLVRA
jgi:hypothetical protein